MNGRGRRWGLALGMLLALVGSLAAAGTAWAHAELISSTPANQSVLTASPTEITLQFTENVDPITPGIRVVDADGDEIPIGDVDQPGGGATMRVGLPEELGDGTYVVGWQVVSADSHRIRGAFTFSVGEESATAPGLVDELFDSESSDQTESLLLGVGRSLSYAGIGVFVGVLAMAAVLSPSLLGTRRVGLVMVVAAEIAFVGTLWMIAAQARLLTGSPWSWAEVADTQSGRWWFARLVGIAALGLLVPLRTRVRSAVGAVGAGALCLGLFAVVAAGGHAVTGDLIVVGFVATVVHLAAMSVWLGGLVLLVAGLPHGEFWSTARRFSPFALGAVVVLALTGVVNGWRQLGSVEGLTDSSYGRWLVVKVLIVAVVVAIAAVSRRALHRGEPDVSSLARRTVVLEVAGMALVLMATAGLVNTSPPLPQAQTESASAVVGERIAQVELEPAVTGGTELHVYITSPSGGLDRADEITVTAELPSADLGPLDIDVVPAGPNHVIGADANLPVAGRWTFEVTARYGEFDQVVFRVEIPVQD